MKYTSPVYVKFGEGNVGLKTQGLLNARSFTGNIGMRDLDIAAYTSSVFSDFNKRTGLLEFEAEIMRNPYQRPDKRKFKELSRNASLLKPELEVLGVGFSAVCAPDRSRNDVYVRPDEAWRAVGTGLGTSKIAVKETLEMAVINALLSQFEWNAILFKIIKGIADSHFGLMLTNTVRSVHRQNKFCAKTFPPQFSFNYLGEFHNRALVQISEGFMDGSAEFTNVKGMVKTPITVRLENGEPATDSFGARPKIKEWLLESVSKLPRSCYLEAVGSIDNFVKGKILTLVQHWPVDIPDLAKPSVNESSIVLRTNRVVQTSVSTTKGVNPYFQFLPGIDNNLIQANMRNIDEQVEFNSGNKGYLFAAKFYQTDQMKLMPLAALSNCGAMLLHSTSTTNEANSHLDGLIRELGVPVLVINIDVQFHQIRDLAMGSLRICADEFNREGWISTDVPSAANKPEKKRFSLWPF